MIVRGKSALVKISLIKVLGLLLSVSDNMSVKSSLWAEDHSSHRDISSLQRFTHSQQLHNKLFLASHYCAHVSTVVFLQQVTTPLLRIQNETSS